MFPFLFQIVSKSIWFNQYFVKWLILLTFINHVNNLFKWLSLLIFWLDMSWMLSIGNICVVFIVHQVYIYCYQPILDVFLYINIYYFHMVMCNIFLPVQSIYLVTFIQNMVFLAYWVWILFWSKYFRWFILLCFVTFQIFIIYTYKILTIYCY